jgi:hypothetical protein
VAVDCREPSQELTLPGFTWLRLFGWRRRKRFSPPQRLGIPLGAQPQARRQPWQRRARVRFAAHPGLQLGCHFAGRVDGRIRMNCQGNLLIPKPDTRHPLPGVSLTELAGRTPRFFIAGVRVEGVQSSGPTSWFRAVGDAGADSLCHPARNGDCNRPFGRGLGASGRGDASAPRRRGPADRRRRSLARRTHGRRLAACIRTTAPMERGCPGPGTPTSRTV